MGFTLTYKKEKYDKIDIYLHPPVEVWILSEYMYLDTYLDTNSLKQLKQQVYNDVINQNKIMKDELIMNELKKKIYNDITNTYINKNFIITLKQKIYYKLNKFVDEKYILKKYDNHINNIIGRYLNSKFINQLKRQIYDDMNKICLNEEFVNIQQTHNINTNDSDENEHFINEFIKQFHNDTNDISLENTSFIKYISQDLKSYIYKNVMCNIDGLDEFLQFIHDYIKENGPGYFSYI